jgi:hypothetical protein
MNPDPQSEGFESNFPFGRKKNPHKTISHNKILKLTIDMYDIATY